MSQKRNIALSKHPMNIHGFENGAKTLSWHECAFLAKSKDKLLKRWDIGGASLDCSDNQSWCPKSALLWICDSDRRPFLKIGINGIPPFSEGFTPRELRLQVHRTVDDVARTENGFVGSGGIERPQS
jgi:hypothetical protein